MVRVVVESAGLIGAPISRSGCLIGVQRLQSGGAAGGPAAIMIGCVLPPEQSVDAHEALLAKSRRPACGILTS